MGVNPPKQGFQVPFQGPYYELHTSQLNMFPWRIASFMSRNSAKKNPARFWLAEDKGDEFCQVDSKTCPKAVRKLSGHHVGTCSVMPGG